MMPDGVGSSFFFFSSFFVPVLIHVLENKVEMAWPQAQPAAGAAGGQGGAAAGGGSLEFLRSNPQFQALRQIVQANPQILQPMLQVCKACL